MTGIYSLSNARFPAREEMVAVQYVVESHFHGLVQQSHGKLFLNTRIRHKSNIHHQQPKASQVSITRRSQNLHFVRVVPPEYWRDTHR